MTIQGQTDDYRPPQIAKASGPPRAIYLAPVYEYRNKQRLIVGERLTSLENLLSAEPHDEDRYLRKGFKLATKQDIARLTPLEGHQRRFDQPLETMEEFGITLPSDVKAKYLENQNKALEQKVAALEAEKRQREERNTASVPAKTASGVVLKQDSRP